jgi:hypothetical protein
MRGAGRSGVALAALLSLTSAARAEGPEDVPSLVERAAARARDGRPYEAIDLYERARRADPRKDFACEIAAQYEALADRAGDGRDVRLAVASWERCAQSAVGAPRRAEAEAHLARLRPMKDRTRARLAGPGAPPPLGLVPVRLLAYDRTDAYEVTLDGASCTTPCTLGMTPGPVRLTTRGSGGVDLRVTIPGEPVYIRLQNRNTGLVAAGGVLVPVGTLMAATMWMIAQACPRDTDTCQTANEIVWPIAGTGLLVTGIVLLALSHRTPHEANRVLLGGSAPSLSLGSLTLTPRGVGVTF